MDSNEQTSLKGLFQEMIPESVNVVRGKVVSASPLKIQVVNDDKLLLSENLLCVPGHLTDYTTTCNLLLGDGSLSGQTKTDGQHGGHLSGDGSHNHSLSTFNIYSATLTVHNALKLGETVYLLSFNEGKKYYILDREV